MTVKKDHKDKFMQLEKLSRESVFTTPDEYFEQLPNIIQEKALKKGKGFMAILELPVFYRIAGPAFVVVLALTYFGLKPTEQVYDVQAMLDEVSTSALISYLDESEMSTEEFLGVVNIEEIETGDLFIDEFRLLNDDEVDELFNELDDIELEVSDYDI